MKTNLIIAALAFAVANPAAAIAVPGETTAAAGTAPPAVKPSPAAVKADDVKAVRSGLITNVSDRRERIEIDGTWLDVVDGTTLVFRSGRLVKRDQLFKGQTVRFSFAGGTAGRTTLGAVYVP